MGPYKSINLADVAEGYRKDEHKSYNIKKTQKKINSLNQCGHKDLQCFIQEKSQENLEK